MSSHIEHIKWLDSLHDKLECHSGTKKEEIVEFLEKNKGREAQIHFEANIYNQWGDDHIHSVTLHETGLQSAIDTVYECYIHNVYIL